MCYGGGGFHGQSQTEMELLGVGVHELHRLGESRRRCL